MFWILISINPSPLWGVGVVAYLSFWHQVFYAQGMLMKLHFQLPSEFSLSKIFNTLAHRYSEFYWTHQLRILGDVIQHLEGTRLASYSALIQKRHVFPSPHTKLQETGLDGGC